MIIFLFLVCQQILKQTYQTLLNKYVCKYHTYLSEFYLAETDGFTESITRRPGIFVKKSSREILWVNVSQPCSLHHLQLFYKPIQSVQICNEIFQWIACKNWIFFYPAVQENIIFQSSESQSRSKYLHLQQPLERETWPSLLMTYKWQEVWTHAASISVRSNLLSFKFCSVFLRHLFSGWKWTVSPIVKISKDTFKTLEWVRHLTDQNYFLIAFKYYNKWTKGLTMN